MFLNYICFFSDIFVRERQNCVCVCGGGGVYLIPSTSACILVGGDFVSRFNLFVSFGHIFKTERAEGNA